jgi:histidinol-phosphatase
VGTERGSLAEDLALAHRLADMAAEIALEHFHRGVTTEIKPDGSPVSEADLEVERRLVAHLAGERPDDGVLSEEGGSRHGSGRRWLLDPIDGTVNFVAHDPEWGTHVALEVDGEIVLGVITRPVLESRWWATLGGGSFRADTAAAGGAVRLHTSGVTELERSRVTLWPPVPCEALDALQRAAVWVEPDFTILRQLLDGEIDAIVACAGGPWDHAPAVILTEEAGGRFRDHQGGRRLDLGGGVYTNGHIDDALAQVLACSGPWDPSPTDRAGGG